MWFVSSRPMVAQRPRDVAAEVLRDHSPGRSAGQHGTGRARAPLSAGPAGRRSLSHALLSMSADRLRGNPLRFLDPRWTLSAWRV